MLRFYADTNIVHLLEQTWKPAEFDRRAKARDAVLALGFHVLYELARGFRNRRHRPAVSSACRFLAEIRRVEFLPTVQDMVRAEFHRAVTGLELITVLSPANQLLTRQELLTMARSGATPRALQFVERREADARLNNPLLATANMHSIRAGLKGNPLARRLCASFQGFRHYMSHTADPMLRRLARGQRVRATDAAIWQIVGDPSRFPVLNTWLNAQWYLMWVAALHRQRPAWDKLDDFRHLAESARCDVFVTDERALVKRAQDISPFRPTISWADLQARLS